MATIEQTKQQLRKKIKLQRRTLTRDQLAVSEQQIGMQFAQFLPFHRATNVATYIPCNGEISPVSIEKHLTRSRFYLPRITHFHFGKMAFYHYTNRLLKNRYGIYEPEAIGSPAQLSTFDLIFVPLVAFDRNGNRLGMGGGFYDRALAFRNNTKHRHRPLLIGLAHHFQEVESLTAQSWDVALDAILTDRELIKISI